MPNVPDNIAFHDRLDKMLHVEEFTDAVCGSLNLRTGTPQYCCYECPTLKANIMKENKPDAK